VSKPCLHEEGNKGVEMGETWSMNQEEDLHRQNLFRKTRNGDEKATQEIQEVYGVRLWSSRNGKN
jgi:hypothetical protein